MATTEQKTLEFLGLQTKKDINAFAKKYNYKITKKTSKEAMKKELFKLMYPMYDIDYKTVEIVIEEHSKIADKIVYIGNDGFFYDSQGNVVHNHQKE